MGRQPWIVFGLHEDGRRRLPRRERAAWSSRRCPFTLLYGALMVADIYLLAKYARAGVAPAGDSHADDAPVDSATVAA